MKAVALALLVATSARAAEPVFDSPEPAPPVYGPLVWRDQHGYWFRDEQVNRLNLRLQYLTDKAAKECTDATTAATSASAGARPWLYAAGIALVVGIAGGFYLGRK